MEFSAYEKEKNVKMNVGGFDNTPRFAFRPAMLKNPRKIHLQERVEDFLSKSFLKGKNNKRNVNLIRFEIFILSEGNSP